MPSHPKNIDGTASHILLVEEYPALASAFSALLRKFAPRFKVDVVRTLEDAESAARTQAPDLLIIDFDPGYRDAVAFFKRLRTTSPDARVLIIAADDAREIAQQPNGPSAFSFIKKPFEVNAFGRTVTTLIDPESSAPTLRELGLVDLLVLHAVSAATSVIQVKGRDGRSGEIHFSGGRITHALLASGQTGVEALQEILRWPAPRVEEARRRVDAPRSIQGGWAFVLLEALRATLPTLTTFSPELPNERPVSQPTAQAAPPPPPPQMPVPPAVFAGKKILVIDDTEMLLIFVDEILSTSDPALKIVTAATGMEGVEKARAEQPDLILLDYSLPDITGGEVCQHLLDDEKSARLPVVMMSGHVPEMLRVAEEYENVVAAIPKPFLSTTLLELVEQTMADLPKLAARPRKKSRAAVETKAPPIRPPKSNGHKLRNGEERAAAKVPPPPVIEPLPPPPPPAPILESAEIEVALEEPPPPPLPTIVPMPAPEPPSRLAPAVLAMGGTNTVVLTLPLEVLSIQFSPTLQMQAIRARPFASTVSLHILPQSLPGSIIPEAGFELASVDLDTRGQIDTIRLVPSKEELTPITAEHDIPMAGISLLPANGDTSMELMPDATAPMRMQLTALFELAGVELSGGFRVAHLVLKWRGGKMRVSLQQDSAQSGVTFETAQVLLDRSAKIAEVLLDAVA